MVTLVEKQRHLFTLEVPSGPTDDTPPQPPTEKSSPPGNDVVPVITADRREDPTQVPSYQPFLLPIAPTSPVPTSRPASTPLPQELRQGAEALEAVRNSLARADKPAAIWDILDDPFIVAKLKALDGDPTLNQAAATLLACTEVLELAEVALGGGELSLTEQRAVMESVRRVSLELSGLSDDVEKVPKDALSQEDRAAVLRVFVDTIAASAHVMRQAPAVSAYGQQNGTTDEIAFATDKSDEAETLRWMVEAVDGIYNVAQSTARKLSARDTENAVTADKLWLKSAIYEDLGVVDAQRRMLGELLNTKLPQATLNLRPAKERWERPGAVAFGGTPSPRPWFFQSADDARKVGHANPRNIETTANSVYQLAVEAAKNRDDRDLIQTVTLLRQWAEADTDPLEIRHLASLGQTLESVVSKLEKASQAGTVPKSLTRWVAGNLELVKASYWSRSGQLKKAQQSWETARDIAASEVGAAGQPLYDEAVEKEALALSAAVIGNGYGGYSRAQAEAELRRVVEARIDDSTASPQTQLAAVFVGAEAIMRSANAEQAQEFVREHVRRLGARYPQALEELESRVEAWKESLNVGSLTALRRVWLHRTVGQNGGARAWTLGTSGVGAVAGSVMMGFRTGGPRGAAVGALYGGIVGSQVGVGSSLVWQGTAAIPPALSAGRTGMTHLNGEEEWRDWRRLGGQSLFASGVVPLPKQLERGRFGAFVGLAAYDSYDTYHHLQRLPEGPTRQRAQAQMTTTWAAMFTLMAAGIALRGQVAGGGNSKRGGDTGGGNNFSPTPPSPPSSSPFAALKEKLPVLERVTPKTNPLRQLNAIAKQKKPPEGRPPPADPQRPPRKETPPLNVSRASDVRTSKNLSNPQVDTPQLERVAQIQHTPGGEIVRVNSGGGTTQRSWMIGDRAIKAFPSANIASRVPYDPQRQRVELEQRMVELAEKSGRVMPSEEAQAALKTLAGEVSVDGKLQLSSGQPVDGGVAYPLFINGQITGMSLNVAANGEHEILIDQVYPFSASSDEPERVFRGSLENVALMDEVRTRLVWHQEFEGRITGMESELDSAETSKDVVQILLGEMATLRGHVGMHVYEFVSEGDSAGLFANLGIEDGTDLHYDKDSDRYWRLSANGEPPLLMWGRKDDGKFFPEWVIAHPRLRAAVAKKAEQLRSQREKPLN